MTVEFIADDGTVCKTYKEYLRINAHIKKLLSRDRARNVFGQWINMEKADWFTVHIAKRRGLIEILRGLSDGHEF